MANKLVEKYGNILISDFIKGFDSFSSLFGKIEYEGQDYFFDGYVSYDKFLLPEMVDDLWEFSKAKAKLYDWVDFVQVKAVEEDPEMWSDYAI